MKVLFIGYGSIAKKHRAALHLVYPTAELFALRSDINAEPIEGMKNLFHWSQVPDTIDFAIVANPTYKHVECVKELVQRQISVFLEKPIAHQLDGLDQLCRTIKNARLPSYVACNLRFLSSLIFLKDRINEGKSRINEVSVYAGSYLPDWRVNANFRENYSAHSSLGGGVHLDLFHELDYTCWLFGLPPRSYSIKRSSSSLNIDAVDFASYSFLYEDFAASVCLNYYRRQPKRTIEVVFNDDVWLVDLLKNNITNASGETVFEDQGQTIVDTYVAQMHYFVNALVNHRPVSFNSFEESLQILKICLSNDGFDQ